MKQFVRQHFEDFVNNCDAAVIHRNMTAGFLDHDGPGGKPTDVATDEAMMEAMYAKMPGITVTIEDMIAEDDKVMCRNRWRWTDAATGATVTAPALSPPFGETQFHLPPLFHSDERGGN